MIKSIVAFVLLLATGLPAIAQKPDTDPAELTRDFRNWWNYFNEYTQLGADFIPMDAEHSQISKAVFLDSLVTGRYIPRRLNTGGKIPAYSLWVLAPGEDNLDIRNIRAIIQSVAFEESRNLSLEGQPLPPYQFTDLGGKHYTNNNTRNKILVLKYWFISCVPCIEEMPELNQLVKKYRQRKDLLFVSVAMDGAPELRQFLLHHSLSYAVVPDQKYWLTNIMEAYSYPTHIIVGKNGKIVKVMKTAALLRSALSKIVVN
jgi:thiol-disulfide isomerase/thioredoxin